MLVDVQVLLDSACIWSKDWAFIVSVIVVMLQLVFLRSLNMLLLDYLQWIFLFIQVWSSNEKTFLSYEIIHITILLILSAKCRDLSIVCVHGSAHSINKLWLVRINKTVNFIRILLNFFSEVEHFWKTLYFSQPLLTLNWSSPQIALEVSAKLNAGFVLELFNSRAILNPLLEHFLIVRSCI